MGGLWHCFTHSTMGVPEPEKPEAWFLEPTPKNHQIGRFSPSKGIHMNPRAQFAAWIVPQNQHVYESKQNQTVVELKHNDLRFNNLAMFE